MQRMSLQVQVGLKVISTESRKAIIWYLHNQISITFQYFFTIGNKPDNSICLCLWFFCTDIECRRNVKIENISPPFCGNKIPDKYWIAALSGVTWFVDLSKFWNVFVWVLKWICLNLAVVWDGLAWKCWAIDLIYVFVFILKCICLCFKMDLSSEI